MKYFYFLKKNIFLIVLVFLVFLLGQMISVIGSKKILEPVTISAYDINNKEPKSFKRFMQLTRAGNYNLILFSRENTEINPWKVEGVFIKKILVGFNKKDFDDLKEVKITIGDKKFIVTKDEISKNWLFFDKEKIKPDLRDVIYSEYFVFETPNYISLERSKIPLYKDFFSNIINWSGDSFLFLGTFIKSLIGTSIFFLFFIFYNFLFREKISKDSSQNNSYSEIILMTILSSLFVSFVVYFVYLFYKPDIGLILKEAYETYLIKFQKDFRPKPVERMQFLVSLFLLPFIIYLSYFLTKKDFFKKIIELKFLIIGFVIFVLSFLYTSLSVSGFYFISDSIIFSKLNYLYFILFLPTLVYFFVKNGGVSLFLERILFVIIIFIFFIIFSINLLPLFNDFVSLTLDPVIYPVSQVFVGKSLLVNLTSLYGLFPFYLSPLFYFINLNVYNFSIILALLVTISFYFLFRFLMIVVKNRIILYLGFLFLVFYTLLATRMIPENYYQYWPVRFLFPTLWLLFASLYFKYRKISYYYIAFIVSAFAVLWNFDVGVVVFLTWLLSLFYDRLSKFSSHKLFFKELLKIFLYSILSLIVSIGSFVLITFYKSGFYPDWSMFFEFQKMFLSGYFMIKLVPPPHVWSLLIFVYVFGLVIATYHLFEKSVSFRSVIIFILSILGFGLFVYYEGQASDVTLFRVWYPALLMFVMFTDYLWEEINSFKRNLKINSIIFFILFGILSTGVFSIFINLDKYTFFVKRNIFTDFRKNNNYYTNIDFLKNNTEKGESVFILADLKQGIYYAETNTKSVIDVPSISDIFYKKQMDEVINFLQENKNTKVFIEGDLKEYDKYSGVIKEIVSYNYFNASSSNGGMVMYLPKN